MPFNGGEGGVGEGLREDVGEVVGDPDTTNRPPDLTAAAGGTDGVCNVTGRV
jgi:hypothetical protein